MATSEDDVIVIADESDEEISPDVGPSSAVVSGTNPPPQKPTENETAIDCPICLQTCIHPAKLPCGHIFCFLCVKGVAYKNRRCAMCRREIPPEFLDHPQLVNGIQDICKTKTTEDGYQWFYEGRNGGWWAYDSRTTVEVEEAFQVARATKYDILICGSMYTIDFTEMIQYPKSSPHRWWQYDDRTSQDIEEAYKKGEKSCTILVAGYVYVVDFEGMLQQRQNEPSRRRHVKRDLASIPKKGVAGLRIEGNAVATDSNFASQVYHSRQLGFSSIDDANRAMAAVPSGGGDYDDHHHLHPQSHRPINQVPSSSNGSGSSSASDFISTVAATDAAIRIASDIIGSTLAHADEISRQDSSRQHNSSNNLNSISTGSGNHSIGESSSQHAQGNRELLDVAEELLDVSSNTLSNADQHTIDLFEQTLNDFHLLTLRNIIDSSESDDDDNEQLIL